jgi:hypothetical protein
MTTKVKVILQNHVDLFDMPLTAENAEQVIEIIGQATTQATVEWLKTYLETGERPENSIVHNGEKYQFNRDSNKEFQTPFGKIVLKRRLYQNKKGDSFVPLDHAWNMEHQSGADATFRRVVSTEYKVPSNDFSTEMRCFSKPYSATIF